MGTGMTEVRTSGEPAIRITGKPDFRLMFGPFLEFAWRCRTDR